MGATENAFYELACSRGIRLERQVTVPGLSSRGHVDPVLLAADSRSSLPWLANIFDQLDGDGPTLLTKRSAPLRLDFYAPDLDVYIEVDETQHFTTDRGRTFDSYGNDVEAPWIDQYRRVIETWSATGDNYRAAKPAVDFPRPGGRRAQRAYFDAVRDLGAPELGVRLLRVPAPECDGTLAFARFETALARS